MKFARQLEKIVTDDVELDFFKVPWDSEIFGFPVAQIDRILVKDRRARTGDGFSKFRAWLDANDIRLASCRLPSDGLRESMVLEEGGFRFVEMTYSPVLSPLPASAPNGDDLQVTDCRPDQIDAVMEIAESAFTTARFCIDWRLDPGASHRRYRRWVANSIADPQQSLWTAAIGDAVVGFFVVEPRADRSVYWHLTAVAPEWQHKRIGRRLWTAVIARHRADDLQRIDTTISAHNVAAMNLYARHGFNLAKPQMTFHWLRP